MTSQARGGVALVIVVMWTAVSVVAWPRLGTRYRLRGRAAVTQGEVIRVDPEDHNRATYRYTVSSKVFESSEIASHRRRGDSVRVYFDPAEPNVAMLSEPGEGLRSDVAGLIVLYVFFAVAALWVGARASASRAT
jgi:Protein of unknown function (DUF3592)